MNSSNGPRLELTWHGKDKFLLSPKDESGKPIWVERDHPAASEVRLTDFTGTVGDVSDNQYADNLLFTGDSLDMLRVLAETPEFRHEYRGKIKLVYIDPPFNTGQTFTHYDDWMDHSTWLSFMRDRLLLIKDLLAPDGSIWVHLDDQESHRMRCLMDEVFGAENFVSSVVWQRVDNPTVRSTTGIAPSHDTIVVYSKSALFRANQMVRSEIPAHYDKIDDEGRPYCNRLLRKAGSSSRRLDRPSMWFPIAGPDGTDVYPLKVDGTEGRWMWGQEKVLRDYGTLDWHKSPRGTWEPYVRVYMDNNATVPFHSWWPYVEVGSNRISKMEVKNLTPGIDPFPTPKPELLMQRVVLIASNSGDVVLDCFGGSGTTAAVAHKMGRRWITSEILPDTVSTFTKPRLEMVVKGEDVGGISKSVGWSGGGGFRTVTIAPSMYELTDVGVMLAYWATNGRFARAVAGQLGFEYESDQTPFCGTRGRMRLAVFDGAVGPEEVRHVVAGLSEKECVTVVAQAVLPGAEELLAELSKGSRVRKAPRDLLTSGARRARRRTEGTSS